MHARPRLLTISFTYWNLATQSGNISISRMEFESSTPQK
jgi:hypothetical protein